MNLLMFLFLPTILYCGYTDARYKLIDNRFSIPLVFTGLIYSIFAGYFVTSLIGFIASFVIALFLWIAGGFGGGDVKVMAGIGAWLGLYPFIFILFVACIAGVIWAAVDITIAGEWKDKSKNIKNSLKRFYYLNFKGLDVSKKSLTKAVPFGTCLAIGTVLFIGVGLN